MKMNLSESELKKIFLHSRQVSIISSYQEIYCLEARNVSHFPALGRKTVHFPALELFKKALEVENRNF